MNRLTPAQIKRAMKIANKDRKPLEELKDLYAWKALGTVGFIPNKEREVSNG